MRIIPVTKTKEGENYEAVEDQKELSQQSLTEEMSPNFPPEDVSKTGEDAPKENCPTILEADGEYCPSESQGGQGGMGPSAPPRKVTFELFSHHRTPP